MDFSAFVSCDAPFDDEIGIHGVKSIGVGVQGVVDRVYNPRTKKFFAVKRSSSDDRPLVHEHDVLTAIHPNRTMMPSLLHHFRLCHDKKLLLEHVRTETTFHELITAGASRSVIDSLVAHCMVAFRWLALKGVTHYDAHTANVLVGMCPDDMWFFYRMPNRELYLIKTNGIFPVIVDYGNAAIASAKFLTAPLVGTGVGINPVVVDERADQRTLLCNVWADLLQTDTEYWMPVESWYSGWDCTTGRMRDADSTQSVVDAVADMIASVKSDLTTTHLERNGAFASLMLRGVALPLVDNNTCSEFVQRFEKFIEEYGAFERKHCLALETRMGFFFDIMEAFRAAPNFTEFKRTMMAKKLQPSTMLYVNLDNCIDALTSVVARLLPVDIPDSPAADTVRAACVPRVDVHPPPGARIVCWDSVRGQRFVGAVAADREGTHIASYEELWNHVAASAELF